MPQPRADTTQRGEKIVLSTRNDLGVEVREKATALLNQHLADATDLYSQTKQAHWNVKGMQFSQLHELFDTLADSVEEFVDLIAERVTSLGGVACGAVRLSAAASRLPASQSLLAYVIAALDVPGDSKSRERRHRSSAHQQAHAFAREPHDLLKPVDDVALQIDGRVVSTRAARVHRGGQGIGEDSHHGRG
jgi:Ferritin-like domain